MIRQILFPLLAALLVFSGSPSATALDGTLLWEYSGGSYDQEVGNAVANAGDVNGDGKQDVAVGAPGGNAVYILSGADGALLRTFTGNDRPYSAKLGYSLATAGDFNNDGTPDILAGANSISNSGGEQGYARILSGAEGCQESPGGCVLLEVKGYGPLEFFGFSVGVVGDLTGDGVYDVLVGAPGAANEAGAARLFSGSDGSLIKEFAGRGKDNFGRAVAPVGDVNGDKVPDFLIGAPKASPGVPGAGKAVLFSGKRLIPLRTFKGGMRGEGLGWSVAGVGRANSDYRPDIAYGSIGFSPPGLRNAGRVTVRSGKDGLLIWRRNGNAAQMSLGWSVAPAGDIDGDGRGDLLAGAPGYNASGGQVRVISGRTGKLLFTYNGEPGDGAGWSVAAADVNDDGRPEVVIGAPSATRGAFGAGYVKVFALAPPP